MLFSSHVILGGPDFLSVTAHIGFKCTYMFPPWSFPDCGLRSMQLICSDT